MNNPVIDVKNLTKSFKNRIVVNNIEIKASKGKIYGFLGPNGSGKTTTMRMLCGLLTPDKGKGTCLGYDIISETRMIRKKVGYMTQKFSFWDDLTIKENLEFVANIYRINNIKSKVDNALQKLHLENRSFQLAGTLSGGWKQRLALAGCILHEPEILLLDEPTAGVDPKARREFWDEISLLAESGLTVLVSTHYMDEAERCNEIVYIAYGNIMAKGSVENVIKNTNLKTLSVCGENISDLRKILNNVPEITTMTMFGEDLHISSSCPEKITEILNQQSTNLKISWQFSQTSLEDAFIYYLNHSKEN